MVASRKTRKIFCTVVRVSETQESPADGERNHSRFSHFPTQRFSTRPSRLLPWADPCIAKLVRKLQDEVRSERSINSRLKAELDPLPATDPEGEWTDSLGWRF